MAPRGPRSVLCVVVVITGAYPTGDGCAPPAISPAMCAMSATSSAPDLGGDGGEGREVDGPRDRGAAAEDDLGPFLEGQVADLVQVDPAGVVTHPVLDGVEPLAGRGDRPAVGEVAAHGQRHAHDRVARLGEGQVDGEVGGRARVRLHVGVVHAEQRLGPVPGDRLDRVDELLALVVAAAGVALGVLVGQHAARRLEHGHRDVVLRRDQPGLLVLPAGLVLDELGDLRVIALDGRDGRDVHDRTSSHAGYTLRRTQVTRAGTKVRSVPSSGAPQDRRESRHGHSNHPGLRPRDRRRARDRVRARAPRHRPGRHHHGGGQRRPGQDHGERAGGVRVHRRGRDPGDGGLRRAAAAPGARRAAGARRVGARRRGLAGGGGQPGARARHRLHHRDGPGRARPDHAGRDRAADQHRAGGQARAAAGGLGAGVRDHGRVGGPRQRHAGCRVQHLGRPGGRGGRYSGPAGPWSCSGWTSPCGPEPPRRCCSGCATWDRSAPSCCCPPWTSTGRPASRRDRRCTTCARWPGWRSPACSGWSRRGYRWRRPGS